MLWCYSTSNDGSCRAGTPCGAQSHLQPQSVAVTLMALCWGLSLDKQAQLHACWFMCRAKTPSTQTLGPGTCFAGPLLASTSTVPLSVDCMTPAALHAMCQANNIRTGTPFSSLPCLQSSCAFRGDAQVQSRCSAARLSAEPIRGLGREV
jgi:hypothetical protein